jgi:hypothetical protein
MASSSAIRSRSLGRPAATLDRLDIEPEREAWRRTAQIGSERRKGLGQARDVLGRPPIHDVEIGVT